MAGYTTKLTKPRKQGSLKKPLPNLNRKYKNKNLIGNNPSKKSKRKMRNA